MSSRVCAFLVILALTSIELWSRFDARVIAYVQEPGPVPEWFSGFPSPNAPESWGSLLPSSPLPEGTWQLYIANNQGTLCIMDLDGRTASPFQPLPTRGPINMGYGEFPLSSGVARLMFVAPGRASADPLMAFVPGPPHDALTDLGRLEGADIAGAVVASGDLTADATSEVVTAPAGTGYPSSFHILSPGRDDIIKVFPFGPDYMGGLTLGVGNFDGVGYDEIAVGQATAPGSVKIYGVQGNNVLFLADGLPLGNNNQSGVNLLVIDLNNDGADELVVTPRSGPPLGRAFGFKVSDLEATRPTPRLYFNYSFFEDARLNGVRAAAGISEGRVFFAASTDDQVRVSFLNPQEQRLDVIRTDIPFGRNSGPVSVIAVPPAQR